MTEIQKRLFALRDEPYRDFVARLIPMVDKERIIGIRTPTLRSLARELARTEDMSSFMDDLPHAYFEENGLHAFLIEQQRDFERCLRETERFLPQIDNWATCDSLSPPAFGRHKAELLPSIRRWLDSGETYTVRFGVNMLMRHFLDADFRPEYLDWVADLRSEEYYVRMVAAWYFATALAKQYEAALPYMERHRLECWTHNKTIQKSVESYRISAPRKEYLKTLKRKK